MPCVFCSIVKKEAPAGISYEDEDLIVFKDIKPSAPIHLLIVPKKHIASLNEISESDRELLGKMVYRAKFLAQKQGISESGYKLVFNCGRDAGQIVDHLHLHLLGGKPLRSF